MEFAQICRYTSVVLCCGLSRYLDRYYSYLASEACLTVALQSDGLRLSNCRQVTQNRIACLVWEEEKF